MGQNNNLFKNVTDSIRDKVRQVKQGGDSAAQPPSSAGSAGQTINPYATGGASYYQPQFVFDWANRESAPDKPKYAFDGSEVDSSFSKAKSFAEQAADQFSGNSGKPKIGDIEQPEGYNDNGSISFAPDKAWWEHKDDRLNGLVDSPWYDPISGFGQAMDEIFSPDRFMTLDGEKYRALQDEHGNWYPDPVDADNLRAAGYTPAEVHSTDPNNPNKIDYQLFPNDKSVNPDATPIRWVGGDAIVNPTQYERDAYSYITSDEFQKYMKDTYGIDNFGADMYALQYDPKYRKAWEHFHSGMHDFNPIYYRSDFSNEHWLNDDGSFNYDAYWDWVDRNANIYDYLMGNASKEGGDWLTSGGLGSNRGLARYAANAYRAYQEDPKNNPNIRFGFDSSYLSDEQQQEYLDQMNAGNLVLNPDQTFSLDGSNFGLGNDENGAWWLSMKDVDPEFVEEYVLRNLIRDSMTNEALDSYYGRGYSPNALEMNEMSKILGGDQYDLYYDRAGGLNDNIDNPYEYFGGNPEAYVNPFAPKYDEFVNYMNGTYPDFNLGATGYARNDNLRRFYRDLSQ